MQLDVKEEIKTIITQHTLKANHFYNFQETYEDVLEVCNASY